MPLFGFHASTKGGLPNAVREAAEHQCQAVQIFTKVASQWKARELPTEEVQEFRREVKRTGLQCVMVHDSYLINLASPDPNLYQRSLDAFVVELERCEAIGAHYLVTHPGSHVNTDVDEALRRVAGAFDEAHRRCAGFRSRILLETTAGQGSQLANRFEHLGRILSLVRDPGRMGVCFDTCHVFAAGYALAPETDYQGTMAEFARLVGLDRLLAFHINDSAKPRASRLDRHAHIGRGEMGLEPFRLLVNDSRFQNLPMVLETPKSSEDDQEDDDTDWDAVNLATLRGLVS